MTKRQAAQIVKPPVIWILVADSRQAQVYTRQKMEKLIPLAGSPRRNQFEETIARAPVPVAKMKWEAESADHYKAGRNATGMVFESFSSAQHMAEPHIDLHEEIRQNFARTITENLNQAWQKKSFDRLVLIAPAKMLGEIKKHLDERLLRMVIAELPKELTHCDSEALAEHLDNIA